MELDRINSKPGSRLHSRVRATLLAPILISASAAAQSPPPPPLLPPGTGPQQGTGTGQQLPPQRRPVKGNMNGLLDYMADVDVTDHEEVDFPAVGYGNELLWEAGKPSAPLGDAAPAAAKKRQQRKSGDKDGAE